MPSENTASDGVKRRITVTLGPGQREALEAIAKHNGATLAYVIRYALKEFTTRHRDDQLPLPFPDGV